MQIFVHDFTGKVFPLECESIDTIAHIKARLHVIVGLPPHQQRLIFSGKRLDDFSENKTLAEAGIQEKSSFQLLCRLPGGGGGEIERPRRPGKGYLYYADTFKSGWREEHGKVLLYLLLELCRDCGVKEGNMTNEAWLWIQNSLNISTKSNFEISFLQERLRDYRQLYLLLAENNSPIFQWDRGNKTIYIKSNWRECHPELLLLCGEYIPYFDTLEEVCLSFNTRPSPKQQVFETKTSSNNIKNERTISQDFHRLSIIRNIFRKYGERLKQLLLPWRI